jgi:adenylate cyclase
VKLELLRPTLQGRIVVFFVVLLAVVQLVSFLSIRYAIEYSARETMRGELRVASHVFQRLLDQNRQQLVEATSVLAYDFGFREAIATRDRDTILSALRNHAARVGATGMAVVGLDGIVIADTLAPGATSTAYYWPDLLAKASSVGRAAAVRVLGNVAYQIVIVPVLAPLPIAWVSLTFIVDDESARRFERLSNSDVSFVQVTAEGPKLLASALPRLRRQALVENLAVILARGSDGLTVAMAGEDMEVLATPLEDPGDTRLYAILQRSVSDGLTASLALQAVLMVIAGLSLAVTLFGGIRIARRITQPISRLSVAAREIAAGNYDVRVGNVGSDEIGELAASFDSMAKGLAERDGMRDALGKVASQEVVEQLLQGRIALGGEERIASVLFTDIRNFTTICETLTPQESLALLNEFLTAISEVVERRGGVVDKYLGDGVMAIFGAPVTRQDDAQRAIEAAMEIRAVIEDDLRPSLASRGLPHPEVGIGLNTSHVIAGNIGSPTRLNYTVLGDGVNLAARLEGLTKRYRVPIVVGIATRELARGIVFREIDKVRVKGKSLPVRIFEPLGREPEVPPEALERLDRWHGALESFRARDFAGARDVFESLAGYAGYERLCEVYLGYVRDLLAHPPEADWDASFTLYEK